MGKRKKIINVTLFILLLFLSISSLVNLVKAEIAPLITAVDPAQPKAKPTRQWLAILGSGFIQESKVTLRFESTEYVIPKDRTVCKNPTKIEVFVGLTEPGIWEVWVENPNNLKSNILAFRVKPPAILDKELLDLIEEYSVAYFRQEWNLTLDQYRAWIATIAWGEGKIGGYAAHSQALGSDMFYHKEVGEKFRFSTGIGPFQLDRGGEPEKPPWHNWPTIKKLDPREAVKSVMRWHHYWFGKDATLKDFSEDSVWFAVKSNYYNSWLGRWIGEEFVKAHWKDVTGTKWDDYKNGKNKILKWSEVVDDIKIINDPLFSLTGNIKKIGKLKWNVTFTTDAGKTVYFDTYSETWLINARDAGGKKLFDYYYTYSEAEGFEIWVWNNAGKEDEFKYIFVRNYTKTEGQFPEHVNKEEGYAGEGKLDKPALYLTRNVDVVLVIDRSGSMAWYGKLIHKSSGTLTTDWRKIATFNIEAAVTTFDVLLETGSWDGDQYLRIKSPSGKWYGYGYTSTYCPLDYTHDTYVKYLGADYIAIYQSENVEQGKWEVYASGALGRTYCLAVAVPPVRIDAAKDAAKYLLDLMSNKDQLGLVSFASSASLDKQLTLLDTKEKRDSLKSAITSLVAIGGTAMGDGIYVAKEELTSIRHRAYANPVIILFTNGIWNMGSDPVERAKEAKEAGIKIYTIGYGKVDHELLSEIASMTGGKYLYAPSTSELKSLYQSMIATAKGESTVASASRSIAQGETASLNVDIDSSITQATFTVSWGGSDLDLTLRRPDGTLIDPNVAAADPNIDHVEEATYEIYRVSNPMAGTWQMIIFGVDVPPEGERFVAQITALTSVTLTLTTDKDSYMYPELIKVIATLEDTGIPLIEASVQAIITRPDTSQINLTLFDNGLTIHGDISANDGIYTNYFTQFTLDGTYLIKAIATGKTLIGESFTREDQKTVLVSGVPADTIPPTTTLFVGSPQYTDAAGDLYVTSTTPFTLTAVDNNGTGSGVASIAYRIHNPTHNTGWILYTLPFNLSGFVDGTYSIDYNSTDNAGNVEPTNTAKVILDNTGPSITVLNPPIGWALQDGVAFISSAVDSGSGLASLNFSIREANGAEGIPIGFEDLQPYHNATTDEWSLFFDTLQLPDGYYVLFVEAEDNLGNIGSIVVPYSIRNWAVIELLPASENNKAGRTMPVKFALRVSASVDPSQPFVYNEELTIKIYATNNPNEILQESTFGDTARDYRISNVLYITNFKTLKTPMEYTVTVYRDDFELGSFTFKTVK